MATSGAVAPSNGGVAMMLAAFLQAANAETPPPGDVVLCLLSDEEAGGDGGARFVVDEHAELFDGLRYAIGGGATERLTAYGRGLLRRWDSDLIRERGKRDSPDGGGGIRTHDRGCPRCRFSRPVRSTAPPPRRGVGRSA